MKPGSWRWPSASFLVEGLSLERRSRPWTPLVESWQVLGTLLSSSRMSDRHPTYSGPMARVLVDKYPILYSIFSEQNIRTSHRGQNSARREHWWHSTHGTGGLLRKPVNGMETG